MRIPEDALLEETKESIYDLIRKSIEEATRNDIKANSIVINRNMVRVPGWEGRWPEMICGLNCYFTATELPDGYSFAVLNDCNKETENNWISVKDRLPIEEAKAHEQEWCEEHCEFLVMIERGLLPTTLYYDWENNEWFRINTTFERETYKVTHWMPLPQPPKGE